MVSALVWATLWGGSSRLSAQEDVGAVVGRVDAGAMMADVERLVAFETRFMGSDSNRAAVEWLADRFESMDYVVRRDSFRVDVNRTVNGRTFVIENLTQVNLVVTRPGLLTPDKKIVVGAHYDSISLDRDPDAQDLAPGADDNAAGVAGMLELARILRDVDTDATIEFVAFGAEELGLVGSGDRAARALETGEEIVMMLGLDVLGTRSETYPDAFTLDTSSRNLALAKGIADAAEQYTEVYSRDGGSGSRVRVTASGCRCSDYQSYLDRGFPAIGVFQFFSNPAPHINTSEDTIEHVDIGYASEITRAVLAGTLRVAGFPSRTPDFDGSGVVDFSDFLAFAGVFGTDVSGPDDARFDLNGDGTIGFVDFVTFSENYGRVFNTGR